MNKQRGISIIELLVATALLGLVMYSGFALMNVPNKMRGKQQETINKLEKYQQAFNAFYRVYNQVGASNSNASLIEALTAGPVPIRFSSATAALTIPSDNSYIEIGNSDSSLNNLVKIRIIAQPDESQSLCKLVSLQNSSTDTWSFSCPNSTYSGFRDAFQNNQINELPIVMLDGRICFITQFNSQAQTLRIDTKRNSCLTPTPTDHNEQHWRMFTLPRIVMFSDDKQFSQGIFESFYAPRDRFGNNFYPQN